MKQKQRIMSTRNAIRNNSIMPKNAINFYKLKKGLYLRKNSKGKVNSVSIDNSQYMPSDERAIARSVGILTAYGEMASGVQHKAMLQNQSSTGASIRMTENDAAHQTLNSFHHNIKFPVQSKTPSKKRQNRFDNSRNNLASNSIEKRLN